MNTYASITALLRLWPDLPGKMGQTWPGLYWQLLDLLRRFERAADEADRAAAAIDILRVVRRLPGGVEALQAVQPPETLRWEESTGPLGGEEALGPLRGGGAIKGLFTPDRNPSGLTRSALARNVVRCNHMAQVKDVEAALLV